MSDTFHEFNFDICFNLNGKKIYASRKLLAIWSSVFKAMLYNGMKESNQNEIDLPEDNYEQFKELLKFIHPPSMVEISMSNLETMAHLADKYDIDGVKKHCERFMLKMKSFDDMCKAVKIADMYNYTYVLETLYYPIAYCMKLADHFQGLSNETTWWLFKFFAECKYREYETNSNNFLSRNNSNLITLHATLPEGVHVKQTVFHFGSCNSDEFKKAAICFANCLYPFDVIMTISGSIAKLQFVDQPYLSNNNGSK
jgi:hypothetical protein